MVASRPAISVGRTIKLLFSNLFKLQSNIISLKKYMLMIYFGKYTILWILAFFMFYNKKMQYNIKNNIKRELKLLKYH